jgi:creatinine amidohydrolase/Fe(II)-dependent formamide hydrolase-like protein
MIKLRSLYWAKLTTPEVQRYLLHGGTTVFLPAGAVEMHGPHQPIGTDTLIAEAVSVKLADAVGGLILPEVPYSWAGATDGFAGTISIPPDLFMKLITHILIRCWKMGFRQIVIVSIHGTNNAPLTICVRRIYETHGIVAQYLNPWHPASPEAEALFAGKWSAGKEASMVLAALEILGQQQLYSEKELAYDARPPPQMIHAMNFKGATGFYYQDCRHHVFPTRKTSKQRALAFIDLQVRALAPGIKRLAAYAAQARRQKNQGWGRTTTA